jgi:hypothetical protein
VGQNTGIFSSSQELSPRRKIRRGLFESDDTQSGNTPPGAPNLAAAASRIGWQPRPTPPTDGRPAKTVGKPNRKRRFLRDENHMVDSYVYKKFSTGTPPAGPQVTAAESNRKITATDNANPTNFGGVYGHTLTYSEPDTDNLLTVTAADPTGLLVATPVEGDPSRVTIREYKGY